VSKVTEVESMQPIIKLEHARALKAMHLPLNTPVEEGKFSLEYSEHWFDLMDAHGAFVSAVDEYTAGPRAGTRGKWRLMRRRLAALDAVAIECLAFVRKLGGNAKPLVFKSEQDEQEGGLLRFFLRERVAPFIQYWVEAINAVDAGAELRIESGDIPPWLDDDPA
jgi:hypothetical protein